MTNLLNDNIKVDVYRNLHNGLYSIKALEGPHKGRVIAHANDVYLINPKFVVSQAGRARVLRERKKYVHAVVRGEMLLFNGNTRIECDAVECLRSGGLKSYHWTLGNMHRDMMRKGLDFTYNPYKFDSFVVPFMHRIERIAFGTFAQLSTTDGTKVIDPVTFNLEEL